MENWIKLYIEMLDDPETVRLSDSLWRRLIELFLLTGKLKNDTGELPCTEDIAFFLRTDAESLEIELAQLAERGFISKTEDGRFVKNYSYYIRFKAE